MDFFKGKWLFNIPVESVIEVFSAFLKEISELRDKFPVISCQLYLQKYCQELGNCSFWTIFFVNSVWYPYLFIYIECQYPLTGQTVSFGVFWSESLTFHKHFIPLRRTKSQSRFNLASVTASFKSWRCSRTNFST